MKTIDIIKFIIDNYEPEDEVEDLCLFVDKDEVREMEYYAGITERGTTYSCYSGDKSKIVEKFLKELAK